MESTTTRGKAKLLFVTFYVLGLALIFVVVSSFWQKKVESQQARTEEAIQLANQDVQQELDNLKKVLATKEQKIASLESTIQQNSVVSGTTPGNQSQTAAGTEEKDKMIVALQNQLRQKEAALQNAISSAQPVTNTTSGDGEWRQKYTSLKASFDKVSANEKALKSAYKTVADDNKRLLSQLQSIRKG
jgi:chromosome segregation ATPase